MILTGTEIKRRRESEEIVLEPFDEARVQPNSYDLALGPKLLSYADETLDVNVAPTTVDHSIPSSGFVLTPDKIWLGHSVETVGSKFVVPIVRARSSVARLGLFIHVTADLIDIGSIGQVTFQLHAVQPVRVYAGMRIAQITFWRTQGEITLYDGKYQGSIGPQASKIARQG